MSELTTQGKIRRALADLGELTDLHPLSIDAIREAIDGKGRLVLERPVCKGCPKAMLGPYRWSCVKGYDETCKQRERRTSGYR